MKLHQFLFAATVMFACSSASAAKVQMVVGVTPTAVQTGHYVDGAVIYEPDPSIPLLPTFSMTVKLDLATAIVNPTVVTNDGFNWYNDTFFQNSEISATAYTPSLISSAPPKKEAYNPEYTQAFFSASMSSYGEDSRTAWESFSITNSIFWRSVSEHGAISSSYYRNLYINSANKILASLFSPKNGQSTLDWLSSQVGVTVADGFSEQYFSSIRRSVLVGGQWFESDDPDAVLAWTQARVTGSVQIQSISVLPVPEPASAVLMCAGLLCFATYRSIRPEKS